MSKYFKVDHENKILAKAWQDYLNDMVEHNPDILEAMYKVLKRDMVGIGTIMTIDEVDNTDKILETWDKLNKNLPNS